MRSSADTPYKPDTVVMAMERGSQRLAEIRWSADSTNSRASPTGHPLPALLLTEVESVMAEGLRPGGRTWQPPRRRRSHGEDVGLE